MDNLMVLMRKLDEIDAGTPNLSPSIDPEITRLKNYVNSLNLKPLRNRPSMRELRRNLPADIDWHVVTGFNQSAASNDVTDTTIVNQSHRSSVNQSRHIVLDQSRHSIPDQSRHSISGQSHHSRVNQSHHNIHDQSQQSARSQPINGHHDSLRPPESRVPPIDADSEDDTVQESMTLPAVDASFSTMTSASQRSRSRDRVRIASEGGGGQDTGQAAALRALLEEQRAAQAQLQAAMREQEARFREQCLRLTEQQRRLADKDAFRDMMHQQQHILLQHMIAMNPSASLNSSTGGGSQPNNPYYPQLPQMNGGVAAAPGGSAFYPTPAFSVVPPQPPNQPNQADDSGAESRFQPAAPSNPSGTDQNRSGGAPTILEQLAAMGRSLSSSSELDEEPGLVPGLDSQSAVAWSREVDRREWQAVLRNPDNAWRWEVMVAALKGWLVRRLMRTEKVQTQVKTILDARDFLANLRYAEEVQPQAVDHRDAFLQQRVISQLRAAIFELHHIFFDTSLRTKLSIISVSRAHQQNKRQHELNRSGAHLISSATLKARERREKGGGTDTRRGSRTQSEPERERRKPKRVDCGLRDGHLPKKEPQPPVKLNPRKYYSKHGRGDHSRSSSARNRSSLASSRSPSGERSGPSPTRSVTSDRSAVSSTAARKSRPPNK